jgi:hypothetical protein
VNIKENEEQAVLVTVRTENDNVITTITIKWTVILLIKNFPVFVQQLVNYPCLPTRTI